MNNIIEEKVIPYPYCQEVNVTINEHRAPTDESVKLLNELQEAAMKNLICSIQIDDDNNVKGVIQYYRLADPSFKNRVQFQIKFCLNGKDHLIRGIIDDLDDEKEFSTCGNFRSKTAFMIFYKTFSEEIAKDLMQNSIRQ